MLREEIADKVTRSKEEKDPVKVMVRVRPFSQKELTPYKDDPNAYPISVISMNDKRVDVVDSEGMVKDSFEFHKCFWSIPECQKQTHVNMPFADQEMVFHETGALAVQSALKGYHTCIFAYGQTGSGKTHTMLGSTVDPGISPRLVDKLFEELERMSKSRELAGGFKYHVEISFMEIYNEKVKDLFAGEFPDWTPGPLTRRKSRRASSKQIERKGSISPTPGTDDRESPTTLRRSSKRNLSVEDAEDISRQASSNSQSPPSRAKNRRKTLGVEDFEGWKERSSGSHSPPVKASSMRVRRATLAADEDARAAAAKFGRRKSTVNIQDEEYRELKVRQSPTVGTFVDGLTRVGPQQGISTAEDVKRVMRFGMEHRATAATQMNETSSRSHAIFQLCVRAKNSAKGIQRYSHINLVDLAGSERIKMSGAEGDRFLEATRINLSLGTLRRVIDALIENAQRKKGQPKVVPPYRDAMLTWILSESLGGNSKTMMIATVSPAESNREDSLNTLRYALKAKAIVNTVHVNEQKVSVVVSAMMKDIEDLKRQLEEEEMNPESKEYVEMQHNLEYLETEYERYVEEAKTKEEEIRRDEEALVKKEEEVKKKEEAVKMLEAEGVEESHKREVTSVQEVVEQLNVAKSKVNFMELAKQYREKELEAERIKQERLRKQSQEITFREAAFRKEMLVVKRKQFALAFHKAFKQTKTSSSREKLEAELRATTDRIGRAHLEIEWKKMLSKELAMENLNLEERLKRCERECALVEKARERSEEIARENVRNQQEQKKVQDNENILLRTELKKVQSAYYMVAERRAKEAHHTQERLRHSTVRLESVQNEKEKKAELLAQLRHQLQVLEEEVVQLQAENKTLKESRLTMSTEAERKVRESKKLRGENTALEEELESIKEANDRSTKELCELHSQSLSQREEMDAVFTSHDDLKQFVSYRFFPAGNSEVRSSFERSATMGSERGRVWTNGGYSYRNTSPAPPRSNSPHGISPRSPRSPRSTQASRR